MTSTTGRLYGIAFTVALLSALLWGTGPGLEVVGRLDAAWIAAIYHLLGGMGAMVVQSDGGLYGRSFAIRIDGMCNGLFAWILAVAIALFWPASWRRRLVGAGVAILVLTAFNAVRLASVFLIGIQAPRAAHLAHDWIWPGIYAVVAAVLLWKLSSNADRPTPPAPIRT